MVKNKNRFQTLGHIILSSLICSGCSSIPYNYGRNIEQQNILKLGYLGYQETQIERGKKQPLIDGLGHYVMSLPSKILLLNWRVNNHNISKKNEELLKQYLDENSLNNVKVRLNQYAPLGEWRRLYYNRTIHPIFRYTLGTISLIFYTVVPERLFAGLIGGDNYNPYTNTINLYSGHNAIVLHEAGHAKDLAKIKYKGLYSVSRMLPLVPLFQEGKATGDAIGYFKNKNFRIDEKEAYKILYPAYFSYIGGEAMQWIDGPGYFSSAAVIPGHILGWIKSSTIKIEPTIKDNFAD